MGQLYAITVRQWKKTNAHILAHSPSPITYHCEAPKIEGAIKKALRTYRQNGMERNFTNYTGPEVTEARLLDECIVR